MTAQPNWLEYDVDTMVDGDKNSLWHHLKSHTVFKDKEQMIVVSGKGLKIRDIRGKRISGCHLRRCLERHGGIRQRIHCQGRL